MKTWIAVVVSLVVLVAFGFAVFAVGQVHHENGCSQYRNALEGATSNPSSAPDQKDLAILSESDRADLTNSFRNYQQGLDSGKYDQANLLKRYQDFLAAFVPESFAKHGC